MNDLLNNAADLMDGSDDLLVVRDNYGAVVEVRWHHNNEPAEYLRGIAEVITQSMGLSMDNVSVIYDEILRRIDRTTTKVVDL